MKKIMMIFSCLYLLASVCTAQVTSLKYSISPSFPSVNDERTRVLESLNRRSFVFIDSLDTTYICYNFDFQIGVPTTTTYFRKRLPSKLVISGMEDVQHTAWYCGSKNNDGAYGEIFWGGNYFSAHRVHVFRVPLVNKIRKFTMASQMNDPYHWRMFAIGEAYQSDRTQTYILELDVQGTGISEFGPFNYAKMLDKETVDDVALVNEIVVFSTRDYNSTASKVNLRISNVENMLTGSEIDVQWRLRLRSYESVCGRVFVTHLNDKDVCVSYIIYNDNTGEYYLCLNRINLDEIYDSYYRYPMQEMLIPKGEEILDIKYDENRKVLVVLLDKDNSQGVFIHALPYSTEAYGATRIETEEGERYFSIDMLQEYDYVFNHSYEAWGGYRCFIQSYADDGTVINSCYPFHKQDVLFVEGAIRTATRTLPRGIDDRFFEFEEIPMVQSMGLRECMNQLSDN